MIPSPYSTESLKQEFRVGDSGKWGIDVEADSEALSLSAHTNATSNPPILVIKSKPDQAGKLLYFAADIETALILRATYRRLSHQYSIALPNRDEILNGLIEATTEATPYLVTKCDILDFYGTLNARPIISSILSNTRTSPEIKEIIRAIYQAAGLPMTATPRGLSISTLIAEMALKEFDQNIRKTVGIHRYFRYADDIITFSLPHIQVIDLISGHLSALGLALNQKTELTSVESNPKKSTTVAKERGAFTYLGYEFSASCRVEPHHSRQLLLSIAPNKIQKRKTKAFTAFHAFMKDKDPKLLLDRLNYISANRHVFKTRHSRGARKQKIRTGVHYNYAKCGLYPEVRRGRIRNDHKPVELIHLDIALKTALFGPSSEFKAAVSLLSASDLAALRSISFAQGFQHRIMKRFSRKRVGEICKVWGNE